jgi:acyl-homoserine lactone acylase PvdQ
MTNFATPCLNLVTADKQGNISYDLIGRIPRRTGSEERLLLPRHSDDSAGVWQGFVTIPALPSNSNPSQGFVMSANNPPTRTRATPLSMNWEPPARAERLYQLLISQTRHSVKDVNTIATDYLSLFDREVLLPHLLRILRGGSLDTVNYGRLVEESLDYLENWSGVQDAEDVATTILQMYMMRLFVHTFHDELGPELLSEFTYINNVPVRTIAALLDDEWNILWDDIRSPQRESRDTIIRHAFFDAVKLCQSQLGHDLRRWNWGRLHSLNYRHPFSAVSPEVAAIGDVDQGFAAGSLTSVVQSSYSFWDPFKMIVGPSMRFIADMSTSQVHVVQPTGNSGDLFSPHYRDMARMFRDGKFVTFSLGTPQPSWQRLTLTPAK